MICSGIDALTGESVSIEFDRMIQSVRPAERLPDSPYIAPGFVDLQVNGFAGVDFNNPEAPPDDIARAVEAILHTGVTRFLPTVITGPPDQMLACLRNLHRAQTTLPHGHSIAGFHVEGPHISPDDGPRGAHPKQWVRAPDLTEFGRWQEATEGNIRLVTLSPHWPEAIEYIRALSAQGVTVSVGHTIGKGDSIRFASMIGATMSTHLGNAAPNPLPKFPNLLLDQLANDDLSASFIADRIHLDDNFFRVAVRAKGIERTILVTDAAAPAGAAPGRYRLGELEVDLTADDRIFLAGTSRLAGSTLHMDRAIKNLMLVAGVSLADALRTATLNPARIIRLEGRTKGLVPGDRADIVVFGPDFSVQGVYLGGTPTFFPVRPSTLKQ